MNKKQKLAEFIAAKLDMSRKSQNDIAAAIGLPNANMLSMIKSNKARVPISRIPLLADELDMPRLSLLRLCLDAYQPETLKVIDTVLADLPMTVDEIAVLRGYRELKKLGVVGTDGVRILPLKRKM